MSQRSSMQEPRISILPAAAASQTTGKFSLMSMIWFNLAQALALLIAYGIVTPIGDRLQFAQAWSYLYAQSFVAGVANFITIAIGGTLLLAIYAGSRTQSGSLTKD